MQCPRDVSHHVVEEGLSPHADMDYIPTCCVRVEWVGAGVDNIDAAYNFDRALGLAVFAPETREVHMLSNKRLGGRVHGSYIQAPLCHIQAQAPRPLCFKHASA